jgi:hypothetical protein
MNQRDFEEILILCGIPPNASGFWQKYPERFCDEIMKMRNGSYAISSFVDGELIFLENIVNNFGTPFSYVMVVSKNFPLKGAKVFLLEPDITHDMAKHMYPSDNSLCLYHPDDYSTSWSLLDLRNQACSWCSCVEIYQRTGEWGGAEAQH